MLELQKIFLIVRFFNRISCKKGLKAKIVFFSHFSQLPWGWNVLESERPHHIGWRNTKICIHGASGMEQKPGKCWKLQLLQAKLQVFITYLSEMKTVCSIILLYSSTFYILFLTFFILEIFKFFKYDKFYVRHSASISNLKDVNSSVVRFIHSSFGRKWPNYKTSNNFWKFPTFLYEIKGFQCFIQCKFELNELSVPKLVPCVLPWILKI